MPCASCGRAEIPTAEDLERIVLDLAAAEGSVQPAGTHAARELRLAACRACEYLAAGVMCSWCGCFVQIRSLNPAQTCPDPAGNRWR